MKKILMSILLILIVSCSGIFIMSKNRPKGFGEFIGQLNSNKKETIEKANPIDLSQYMKTYDDENQVMTSEKIKKLANPKIPTIKDKNKIISYDEAREDIEDAFNMLKYSYGAYEYFGGEEVFNKVKGDILEALSTENKITHDTISKLLFSKLEPIITDGHFSVSDVKMDTYKNLYNASNYDNYFNKDNNNYYTKIKNKKYRLASIDGSKSIDNYMKQSIDEDGKLAYVVSDMAKIGDANLKKEIVLVDDKGNEIKENIELTKNWSEQYTQNRAFEEYTIDGVPVLSIKSMGPTSNSDTSLDEFMASGEKYRNSPVFIIDLRGNKGGSSVYGSAWLERYLSGRRPINKSILTKTSGLALQATINQYDKMDNLNDVFKEDYDYCKNALETGQYEKWDSRITKGSLIENKNTIFVLTDKNVASAGEGFLAELKSMENVVVVGSNTLGCSFVANTSHYQMVNSKVVLSFGSRIIIQDLDGKNIDAKGFEPDIVVNSADAMDRTLALIKKYKIGN